MSAETLLSVGIDLGTTTTQLVLSRLTVRNESSAFSVPNYTVAAREVLRRSAVHFTPLRSERELDAEAIARIVDAEIKKLVETARENCNKLLQENINLLHALAKALLDRETITGDDIDLLVKGEPLPPFDADGSAAKQEPAAPAPASADAEGETFKLEAEPSQDGGTGEKTQDETKQQ